MAFSEKLKNEVREMAAFRCCRCHEIGIDVHHIIPKLKGGSDEIDNAAPLCQNCHDRYGDNEMKRKEIRQMRDWWYEVVKEKFHPDKNYMALMAKLDEQLREYRSENKSMLEAISKTLQELLRLNSSKPEDTKASLKHKITQVFDFSPYSANVYGYRYFDRRYVCPFCSKDLTLEINAEIPIAHDLLSPIAAAANYSRELEVLITCPYCNKKFNLKNAKY